MSEENCVNTGIFSTSGCVYTQFSDYLNAPQRCTSSGDCLHHCITGCSGLDQWFALAAAAPTTNSTLDLSGKPWQFLFESQLKDQAIISQELGSHMMQFGVNYILARRFKLLKSVHGESPIPVLQRSACQRQSKSLCGSINGTGTCTITWTAPAGLVLSVRTVGWSSISFKISPLPNRGINDIRK